MSEEISPPVPLVAPAAPRRRGALRRALTRPPFADEEGSKGFFERLSRAQPHHVRRIGVNPEGWPHTARPLRIAFLSDFHAGSHAGDVERLRRIVDEAAAYSPDLALFGGDYVNMQVFGGGRIPPRTIAGLLARLDPPRGRFAVLGNHDIDYDESEIVAALRAANIHVLDHERRTLTFQGKAFDILGLPDARVVTAAGRRLLAAMTPSQPTIVLAHDPAWFAAVPPGPHLTLSGHTHGGQITMPGVGAIVNFTKAPLRWSHGLIIEDGRYLYVSAGLGTSGIPLRIGMPPEYAIIDVGVP